MMTDLRLTAHEWATARQVCTQKQQLALDLWRRGASWKRIGVLMDIDRSTAREHVKRGYKRIQLHLEQQAA